MLAIQYCSSDSARTHSGQRGGPGGGGGGGGRGRGNLRQPLKFEGDFDFESSNAKFDKDEIEKELKKLTISECSAIDVN